MTPESASPASRLSARRRVLFLAVYAGFIVLLVWGAWRVALRVRAGVPLTSAVREIDVWRFYYPAVGWTGALDDADDDTHFDVLLLGGSVLQQASARIESELRQRIPAGRQLRVYDLTKAAHTSRDSLYKMRLLRHRSFDLVVIYHGINDARMNCCKPDDFRNDYGHCDWYAGMQRRVRARQIVFTEAIVETAQRLTPLGEPTPGLRDFGRTIKTPPAFAANINEIVQHSREGSALVLLMTFASHLPEDYTRAAFNAGELGYEPGAYEMTAESWGPPDGVRAAIAAHNGEITRLAGEHKTILVDQAATLTASQGHFTDPCHLTEAGLDAFTTAMFAELDRRDAFR